MSGERPTRCREAADRCGTPADERDPGRTHSFVHRRTAPIFGLPGRPPRRSSALWLCDSVAPWFFRYRFRKDASLARAPVGRDAHIRAIQLRN